MFGRVHFLSVVLPSLFFSLVSLVPAHGQQPSRDSLNLHGPVKSIHTEEPPPTPEHPHGIVTEQEFSPEGWLTEVRRFDANGNLVESSSTKYANGQVFSQESSVTDGPRAGRTVVMHDPQGRVSEVTTYNFDGTVKERTSIHWEAEGFHRTTYDATGKIVSDIAQRTMPISGGLSSETTLDGKVVGETVVQRSPERDAMAQSAYTPEGPIEQRIVRDQVQGTINTRIAPDGRRTTTTRDADGRTVTVENVLPDGHSLKFVHHFDEQKREIAGESYRDGGLTGTGEIGYTVDAYGNWVKKMEHSCNGNGQCQPSRVSATRTITYY